MKITLAAQVAHETKQAPVISLAGLTLTIDNKDYDLSVIPEGGQAEADLPFIGVVTRDACTIQYQYSTDIYESNQSTNPEDYVIDLQDGETLVCPLIKRPVQEEVSADV